MNAEEETVKLRILMKPDIVIVIIIIIICSQSRFSQSHLHSSN
jgi:hypothetical protein